MMDKPWLEELIEGRDLAAALQALAGDGQPVFWVEHLQGEFEKTGRRLEDLTLREVCDLELRTMGHFLESND
jgi:hypothetical protein